MAAGMDLTGLTKDEAWDALVSAVANYTMELTVDGNPVTITGEDMGLLVRQLSIVLLFRSVNEWCGLLKISIIRAECRLRKES